VQSRYLLSNGPKPSPNPASSSLPVSAGGHQGALCCGQPGHTQGMPRRRWRCLGVRSDVRRGHSGWRLHHSSGALWETGLLPCSPPSRPRRYLEPAPNACSSASSAQSTELGGVPRVTEPCIVLGCSAGSGVQVHDASTAASTQRLLASVGAGAVLAVLPDPVTCFAQSRFRQQQDFAPRAGASLVLVDWSHAGGRRVGRLWAMDAYRSGTRVFQEGALVAREQVLGQARALHSCAAIRPTCLCRILDDTVTNRTGLLLSVARARHCRVLRHCRRCQASTECHGTPHSTLLCCCAGGPGLRGSLSSGPLGAPLSAHWDGVHCMGFLLLVGYVGPVPATWRCHFAPRHLSQAALWVALS